MAGCRQKAAWFAEWRRAGKPEGWRDQFVPAGPYSNKVRCRECGSMGYPGVFHPHPWQISHLIGHRAVCEDCRAPCMNLGSHKTCQAHHRVCHDHYDTQYRAVTRLLTEKEEA